MGIRMKQCEIAAEMGVSQARVSQMVKRGELLRGSDGLIDIDDARMAWGGMDPGKKLGAKVSLAWGGNRGRRREQQQHDVEPMTAAEMDAWLADYGDALPDADDYSLTDDDDK